MIELHAETAVKRVELVLREFDHLAPEGKILRVAVLKLHQFLSRRFEHGRVGFAGSVDGFVKPLHLRNRITFERGPVKLLFPADKQFAKLRAPVADVIVRHNAIAEQSQGARQTIA